MSLLMIILICVVAVLGLVDIRRKSISLFALLGLLAFCVIWNLVSRDMSPLNMLTGAVPAGMMFLAVKLAKLNIGTGDILLMAVLGIALGADTVCVTLIVASVSCAVVSGVLLAVKKIKKENTVAFIPFIGAGLAVSGILQGAG